MKQDLATREIEQRQERQKMDETLSMTRPEPETGDNVTVKSNCNTLKMVTGKPFCITKIWAKRMSLITVGGHEVTRNLSESSDQTLMHIDVYADYFKNHKPANPF